MEYYIKFGANIVHWHFSRKQVHAFHWKQPQAFGGKDKLWQSRFLGYFSEAKTEKFHQKTWSVYNILGITIRKSAQYYPEVSAHVPQKVATESSFKGKNTQKN